MKPGPAVTAARQQQSAQPVTARRIWRVFEYRRPVPPRRPRFTT
jgi:hypothetical protein